MNRTQSRTPRPSYALHTPNSIDRSARPTHPKSTGPSAAGKLRCTTSNALKHGLRAEVLALPNEDAAVVEARGEAWNEYYRPQSPAAQHLVNQCVHATLLADRCQRFHAAQLEKQIHEAPFIRMNSRLDDITRLDKLLDTDPRRAVREFRRTAFGCRWLITRWQRLADALENNRCWETGDLNEAIHLEGLLPHVWSVDADVYRLTLYTLLIHPDRPEDELKALLDTKNVSAKVSTLVPVDVLPEPEECRRRLVEMVNSKLTTLREDEQGLREECDGPVDAGLLDRSLILADPQAARLFLRYHAESRTAFHRSFSELIRTLKRDAEDGGSLEDVSEPACPHETRTESPDRSCTSSDEKPVESVAVEEIAAPESVPQVATGPVVAAKSPNEAKGSGVDPNMPRYLKDLEMLQCHAAAHADRIAAKIGRRRHRNWK